MKPFDVLPKPSEEDLEWGPCPDTDFGRRVYSEWLSETLRTHKTASHIVFYFSDWGANPGKECLPDTRRWERTAAFLTAMGDITSDLDSEILVLGSTRGLTPMEINSLLQQLPPKIGLVFEEPTQCLLAPSASTIKPTMLNTPWDEEYTSVIKSALKGRPDTCIPLIAAGDTDWMFSPALSVPAPYKAHEKIQHLADLGSENIGLALGGLHPWVYSPNARVFAEMIWDPTQQAGELLETIAKEDFGNAAEGVLDAWNLFDQAISRYPSFHPNQGMEFFARNAGDLHFEVGSSRNLQNHPWAEGVAGLVPYLVESLPGVIRMWESVVESLRLAQNEGEDEEILFHHAKNIRDSEYWATFALRLMNSQHNLLRRLNVLHWVPSGSDPSEFPWREAMAPIDRDSLENSEAWVTLLYNTPHPVLRIEGEEAVVGGLKRKLERLATALRLAHAE